VFRGQDSDWPLLPKAYRNNGGKFAEYGVRCNISPGDTIPRQSGYDSAFRQLISRFRTGLDRNGLVIPSPPPKLFDYGPQATDPGLKVSSEATPLFALAQHFGLPTPLLDWSHRGHVAAYFALPPEPRPDGSIYVWALRQDALPIEFEIKEAGLDPGRAFMTIETAPRASNPNLHAQAGVFTYIRGNAAYEFTADRYMEEVVAKLYSEDTDQQDYPFMVKLKLPISCAPELRRMLAEDGIDGASMFPGYSGVVRAMKERVLWDRP